MSTRDNRSFDTGTHRQGAMSLPGGRTPRVGALVNPPVVGEEEMMRSLRFFDTQAQRGTFTSLRSALPVAVQLRRR
jgi:hypothetical protein